MALVLPISRVCLVCGVPFTGVPGKLASLAGLARNSQNPELCNRCNNHLVEGDIQTASALAVSLPAELQLGGEVVAASAGSQVGLVDRLVSALQSMGGHVIRQSNGSEALGLLAYFNVPVPAKDAPRQALAAGRELLELVGTEQQLSRVRQPLQVGVASGYVETVQARSGDLQVIGTLADTATQLSRISPPGEISVDSETLLAAGLAGRVAELRRDRAYGVAEDQPLERRGVVGLRPRPPSAALGLLLALVAAPCAAMVAVGPAAIALGAGALFTALMPAIKLIGMNTGLRLSLAGLALLLATVNLIVSEFRLSRVRELERLAGHPLQHGRRQQRAARWIRLLTLLVYGAVLGELILRITVMKMPVL